MAYTQQPAPSAPPVAPVPTNATVPLWAPLYGASFGQAVKRFFAKYATFSGRASRSEYWWWYLASVIAMVIPNILVTLGQGVNAYGELTFGPVAFAGFGLALVLTLATFIPSLAVTVRRLHDGGFSGWVLLLGLVPLFGIAVIVFLILGPKPEGARFDRPTA